MCTLPRLLTAGGWHSSPLIGRYINYKVAPGGCGCCWTGGGICRTSGDESDSLRWKLRRQRRRRPPTDRCRRDTTGVGCFAWVSPQRPQLQDVGNSVFSLIVVYLGLDLYIWFFSQWFDFTRRSQKLRSQHVYWTEQQYEQSCWDTRVRNFGTNRPSSLQCL